MRKPDGQRSKSGALQPRSDALFPSTRRRNLVGLHAVPTPEQGRAAAGEADRGGCRDWGRGAPPRMEERGSYFNEHPHWGQFQPAMTPLSAALKQVALIRACCPGWIVLRILQLMYFE